MKHLKKFNESTESKKRLSVEDIEDYFLEFIDNGSMEFYYNNLYYDDRGADRRFIHTTFRLSDKFRDITTPEELNNFSSLINKIGEVVKRWNLDFKFSTIKSGQKPGGTGAFQTELSIIQPIPKVVIDNFFANQNPLVRNRVVLDKMTVDYIKDMDVDDNSDFILSVKVKNLFSGGMGLSGKWLKEDYQNFSNSEEEFINFFVDNKELPCEFIKKVPSKDMRYGKPFYEMWYFKLLV